MRTKIAMIVVLVALLAAAALVGATMAGADQVSGAAPLGVPTTRHGRRRRSRPCHAGLRQRHRRRRRRPARPRSTPTASPETRPRNRQPAAGRRRTTTPSRPIVPPPCRPGRRRRRRAGDEGGEAGAEERRAEAGRNDRRRQPGGNPRRRHPQRRPRRRQRRRLAATAAREGAERDRRRRPAAEREDDGDGGSQFDAGGAPTLANPTTTIAPFGPAPIGVPNFVIDSFEIPPFLLPIYQACGTEYGIPWEVLASINKIETAFGTNLNVSSAGAVGWMQFLPSSWEMYGVDANGDGRKDPYNPVDAICAAAHYLKVAGGDHDLYDAIFAYNHADWYVQEVLLYARAYGKLPTHPGRLADRPHRGRPLPGRRRRPLRRRRLRPGGAEAPSGEARISGNAAEVISSSPTRRGINIFAAEDSPVVAVNDGVIRKMGELAGARQVRRPRRHLRQPLHLRRARRDRPRPPRDRDAERQGRTGPGRNPGPEAAVAGAAGAGRRRQGRRRRRAPASSPPTRASTSRDRSRRPTASCGSARK